MLFEAISASLLVLIVNLIDLFTVSVAILVEGKHGKIYNKCMVKVGSLMLYNLRKVDFYDLQTKDTGKTIEGHRFPEKREVLLFVFIQIRFPTNGSSILQTNIFLKIVKLVVLPTENQPFLFGVSTRFGRQVRINNRLIS